MIKYCELCEKEVSGEDINFCPNCGGKLIEKVDNTEKQKEESATEKSIEEPSVTEKNEVHENLLFEKSKDLGKISYKWISTKVKIDGDEIWIVQEVKKIFRKARRKENGIAASDIRSVNMQVKWDFWDTLYGIIFALLGIFASPWYFILAVIFLLCGYGKIIKLKVKDGSEYIIPVEGETLDSAKLMNYCTEKLDENASFAYSEEKHKQDMGESKKSKFRIIIVSIIGIALIFFAIPFISGQKEDNKIEKSQEIVKKLQEFTVVRKGDEEYNFEFSDKWRLQYTKGNVSARIKEDQIVPILNGAFEETDLGLKGEFAYDLDKGDLIIFMDADTSEGWVTNVCYNLNEEYYTVTIDGDEYTLTEWFREYLDDSDLEGILKRDVDSFVNTLEENGLTLEDVESLEYFSIDELVSDDLFDNTYEEVEVDKEIVENNIDTADLTYNFEEDVQNGLLYGSENGTVTDKDGNEIPEYDYIEVQPNGGLLMYGEVAECYSAGAGGKIVFTIPPEVDYGADSEISGGATGYNLEMLPENDYGYLIEGSESRVVSEEEISSLNQTALTMAIKEIYARRGVIFNDATIQAYFEGKNWYAGSIPENDFQDTRLNEVELMNIEILQNCIDNYVEADPNDTGDYLNMNTAYSIEELENMIGKNVRYSGILISNNIDAFSISDANYILPNVTVVYNPEKLRNTPSNSYLQERQLYVTVWGILKYAGSAPLIEMKYICMGGSESDKGSARLITDGDWPDNYDTPIKCIGILKSEGGKMGYLSWGKEEYQKIGIGCDWEQFGESTINDMTTIASFTNTPVAIYGRKDISGGITISFIEPLPTDQWSEIKK